MASLIYLFSPSFEDKENNEEVEEEKGKADDECDGDKMVTNYYVFLCILITH